MRLSDQAIATLMVTLQKCILEQTNITEILKRFDFQINEEDETLVVLNPPASFNMSPEYAEAFEDEQKFTTGSD